jgi:hypothetical protein
MVKMEKTGVLHFKQVWICFKPHQISVSSHKAHNDYKRISGRSFHTRYRFSLDFDAKRVVRDFRDFRGELYA